MSSLTNIEKVVGIVVAGLSGWGAFQATVNNGALEKIKVQISQSADDRENAKFRNEWTMKVFEKFADALSVANQTPIQAYQRLSGVSALVETVADPTVREMMRTAVKFSVDNAMVASTVPGPVVPAQATAPGASPNLTALRRQEIADATLGRTQLGMLAFALEEREAPTPPPKNESAVVSLLANATSDKPRWANYDFDVFWCDGTPDAEASMKTAQRILEIKHLDPSASGRWRVRRLPPEKNAEAGYSVKGYEIWSSAPDEDKLAQVLKSALSAGGIPGGGKEFTVRSTPQATPWYLSIFVCPQRVPGGG